MRRVVFPLVALLLTAVAVAAGWGLGRWRTPPPAAPAAPPGADRGPLVYQANCAACHGPEGHGDGPSAAGAHPPPRDFAARPWHFEPTVASIRRVTLDGIPGSAMASFRSALAPADVDAVAEYVQRLAIAAPEVPKALSQPEQALRDAGFVSLLGTAPPPLSLRDGSSRKIRLRDFSGKLVLLHFWGTTCTHCIEEMPALNELERRHGGKLKVLHICADEDDSTLAQKRLDALVPGCTTLTDEDGRGILLYEAQSLPTVWLIAPDGMAIGRCVGARDWKGAAADRLLGFWLSKAD